jgi:voltage-gated sodium channel
MSDLQNAGPQPWHRERVRALVEGRRFQGFIISVILLNAILIGLEETPAAMGSSGDLITTLSWITVAVFVVEIALRLYAHGLSFFRDAWSLFDLFVVIIALIPASGAFSVFRILRVLRIMRLLSTVRSMRMVVGALIATIPGMASIGALMIIVLYIGSIIATQLYGHTDPEQFGTLLKSMLSMFQVLTGDDWANVIRDTTDRHPTSWIFFICFIVIATYIVLNLFVAVAVEALERKSDEMPDGQNREELLLQEVRQLSQQISLMRDQLDSLSKLRQ